MYSIWNVRGLNDPSKVASVKRLLHSHSVDVVSLLEIKIKLKNVLTYQRKFGSSWLWIYNYDHSSKGRIWLGWNANRVTINVLKIHEQFIHCSVSSKDLSTHIHLTVVYGLHSIHDRLPLWEGIRSISIQHYPWLCAGDYNSVLHTSDRLHGNEVTDYETIDFQSLVDDLDLTEVKSKGAFYSWSNKAHTGPRTLSRIDRVFGNQDWLASRGHVETAWGSDGFVWQKLHSVKSSIKSLNSKQFGNIEEKIDQANVELSGIQNLMAQNPDDLGLYAKESDAIKNRQARNRIDSIFDSNQVLLKDPDAISHEIISFYRSLLGTQAPWLPAVDLVTMRRGKQLSSTAQSYLIRPISHAKIDDALKGIDNTKAPGIDGINSFFFKRAWHIVKDDIYASVIDIFTKGTLPKQWNCTTITLVPKIPNASHVKDFRPIACCTMVFNLKSKVITARLAAVIGEVIDDAQAGFIPGKHIGDNILFATELIKGYDHKFISPRCMVKELGFPQRFVSWIWTFLTFVSYSILINGFPAPPFEAKKGLRQGDPICEKLNLTHIMFADDLLMFSRVDSVSVKLLFQAFLKFSGASELSVNLDKSEVYFGGVSVDVQTELRVTARIQGWMAKHLSYAGRLQLVKSVLFAVTKLLWDIAHKADNLWVKWVHIYYFKHKDCWTTPTPAKCYWFLKKILICRDVVNDQGGWDGFIQGNKMKIKKLYAAIRPQVPKVPWKRVIYHNLATLKGVFILWLALWNRLVTKDRQVWNKVLGILHVSKPVQQFSDEIDWLKKICRSSRLKNKVIHVAFTETVYGIWIQRNAVLFTAAGCTGCCAAAACFNCCCCFLLLAACPAVLLLLYCCCCCLLLCLMSALLLCWPAVGFAEGCCSKQQLLLLVMWWLLVLVLCLLSSLLHCCAAVYCCSVWLLFFFLLILLVLGAFAGCNCCKSVLLILNSGALSCGFP
ncbi:uncharacterized protein LOC110695590 [Chenopodium quinoa]|uniref:uncharacterized protein LOC110695590 n=1 Tax=Chenopodium quinoa TaxID=63459 RepID=UPI000B78DE3A|nr:uncharacterized protein LOC110695590 [Chenopodium quinoa]